MSTGTDIKSVTRFSGAYATKAGAVRAMRKMIGHQYEASFPGVSNRFESVVQIREDMVAPTQLQGGWGFMWRYTEANLIVTVRQADGTIEDVPYPTVAHWPDATHPAPKV